MRGVTYLFDRFRLEVRERRLWRDDELVPLRDKVFDTLVLLVEGAGSLQLQPDMIDRLWQDVSVEPNNLQHNISILRKALSGSSVQIETVRGRGYRFVGEVRREPGDDPNGDSKSSGSARGGDSSTPFAIHFSQTPDEVRLTTSPTLNNLTHVGTTSPTSTTSPTLGNNLTTTSPTLPPTVETTSPTLAPATTSPTLGNNLTTSPTLASATTIDGFRQSSCDKALESLARGLARFMRTRGS